MSIKSEDIFNIIFRPYLFYIYFFILLFCISNINYTQTIIYKLIINRIYRCKTIYINIINYYLNSDNRTPDFIYKYNIIINVIFFIYGIIGTFSENFNLNL